MANTIILFQEKKKKKKKPVTFAPFLSGFCTVSLKERLITKTLLSLRKTGKGSEKHAELNLPK